MIITILIFTFLSGSGILFKPLKQFGKAPSGLRLERIKRSRNFNKGIFSNLKPTPMLPDGVSYATLLRNFFKKNENRTPPKTLPSVRTNLKNILSDKPVIIWFGHSSYFIRINHMNILVDPVFSGNASPVSFNIKNFKGSNVYHADDFPELDLVLITHDHYDHLDYKTIIKLKYKTKQFYTSLGVGSHLEHWGINPDLITEFDWNDEVNLTQEISFRAAPARHFSGRMLTRGNTLWSSFILKTPDYKIYLGGDSGYDTHFKEIGEQHGPFDLAILECGQYNSYWPFIHMMPEETAQAAIDLKAKVLLPVHWGKFALAFHAWDDSVKRVSKAADNLGLSITTPLIGEPIFLNEKHPDSKWWENI